MLGRSLRLETSQYATGKDVRMILVKQRNCVGLLFCIVTLVNQRMQQNLIATNSNTTLESRTLKIPADNNHY